MVCLGETFASHLYSGCPITFNNTGCTRPALREKLIKTLEDFRQTQVQISQLVSHIAQSKQLPL